MDNHNEIVSFIWSVADLIRDTFKRGKYQDVILPFTVLRRVDQVLAPTKQAVLKRHAELKSKLDNLAPQLKKTSGYAFYNTSKYDFGKLLDDAPNLAVNLRLYIQGFSDDMRQVLEKLDFDNTLTKLDEAGLLFLVMQKFKAIDLHPDRVSNHAMGTIFEELLRKFNESLNENPGEHFTPREVIRLMADLLLAGDVEGLSQNHVIRTVYDPCCGSGGMLTIAKARIEQLNPLAEVYLYGQEVNPETWAVCKADMLMSSEQGRDADNILLGSSLSKDGHASQDFNYLLTNPPYGKDWKMDKDAVEMEAEKGYAGRFGAGLPRISDGQLLFLQHMLGRMRTPDHGGSRVAIVMNGSPLFTGDSGSGESEIRRWILENDWLEALVALPEQLFCNTGIATYIWILTNRKRPERKGKVLLVDATGLWTPMRKSLGDKRREISAAQIDEIAMLCVAFREGERCRIFRTTDFGYRKVTIERPLRLNFQASPERLARLKAETAFVGLATSKKKSAAERTAEEIAGRALQDAILRGLAGLPADRVFRIRPEFERALGGLMLPKLPVAVGKAILSALSERDETAEICRDKDGHPEPDPELRDTESVPLGQDVQTYFEREVQPHAPDAWLNTAVIDPKDQAVGRVGYEINFNRYFYAYCPPRALEEIEADIRTLEAEIMAMLREMTA